MHGWRHGSRAGVGRRSTRLRSGRARIRRRCCRESTCISMRPIIRGMSGWSPMIWDIRWRSRRGSRQRCGAGGEAEAVLEHRGRRGFPVIAGFARRWAVWIAALLVIAFFSPAVYARWRRRARLRRIVRSGGSASDAAVLYGRMLELLARRGFEKPRSLTPAEFAHGLPGEEQRLAVEFTSIYNSMRFGGDRAGAGRLAGMLREFE